MAFAVEPDRPTAVDDSVYDRGGRLVVAECRVPLAELYVDRYHHRLFIATVAHGLEKQSRPLYVERRVSGFAEYQNSDSHSRSALLLRMLLVLTPLQSSGEPGEDANPVLA